MVLVVAAPCQAGLTLGQLTPPFGGPLGCNSGSFIVQTSVASGPDYRIPPGGGVITRWSARSWPSGGPDQVLQLVLAGSDVGGDGVTFDAFSDFEHLPATGTVLPYTFQTRIPVSGGQRLGLFAQTGPFTWTCAIGFGTNGPSDRNIWGDAPQVTIGAPPIVASHGQFLQERVPVEVMLEPDADHDGYGDESQDQCPTDATTHGPCPVPDTAITTGPKPKSKRRTATFAFESPTEGATFECQLDGGPFQPCSPPHLVSVGKGTHTFAVRATAKGETDASPATWEWKVKH